MSEGEKEHADVPTHPRELARRGMVRGRSSRLGRRLAYLAFDTPSPSQAEWGWVEEISATYVVVRIWDLRRLVLPLSYFIEHPFQNWTRTGSDLIATVFLWVDYTVPVAEVRAELSRILASTDLWKGSVGTLQVTDASEHSIQLRALMDARDSSSAWDLRCHVREKLIDFLQQRYPQCLPRFRGEFLTVPGDFKPPRRRPAGSRQSSGVSST